MSMLTGFLSSAFWGLVTLSLLVFVHEGGHFLAARAFGVRVTEFFLGLPFRYKVSYKSKRFGTEFGVTPFLLGGYNRVCGMEGERDDLLPQALATVQREGRVRASEVAHELGIDEARAYKLLSCLTDSASIRPFYNPDLDEHPWQSEWPEAFETLQRDADLLTEYDLDHDFETAGTTQAGAPRPIDDPASFLAREETRVFRGKGLLERLAILVAGPLVNVLVSAVLVIGSLMIAGIEYYANTSTLGGVIEGSYAEAAGLEEGDTIVQLGGHNVATWDELCEAIDASLKPGASIVVAYERDGQTFETTIEVAEDDEATMLGINAPIETYRPPLTEAAAYTWSYMRMVASMMVRLVMPQHTLEVVSQSTSIVGISAMASEAAASGLNDLVLVVAAISLSLGFMNLLPIPPLDGGKILIELVQAVTRRRIPTKVQNAISYVGLGFFLIIFCFALRNDITRILG